MSGDAPFFASAGEALEWGARMLSGIDDESLRRREARWMLEAAAVSAGRDPIFIATPELTPRVTSVFRSFIARRSRGEPLAYVIGEASFRGIDLIVTSDVLIPRPETEQLVDEALKLIPVDASWRIAEQGTGSGAISVALALARPRVTIVASDLSESAASLAERNVRRHGVASRVDVIVRDLSPDNETFDMIVANLPYVPDGAVLPDEVRDWEPRLALRGGPTGREIIERSIALSDSILTPGGYMVYEIGEEQEEGFESFRPERFEFKKDLSGKTRFMIGKK